MRGEQLARQWRILMFLYNSRRGRHLSEIAEYVQTSDRNIRRDLNALREAGFFIDTEKAGQSTLWKVSDVTQSTPPIPLTMREIITLILIDAEIRNSSVEFLSRSFSSIIDKLLITTNSPQLRSQIKRLQESFYAASQSAQKSINTRDQEIYENVSRSILNNQKLLAVYVNSQGKRSQRTIAPLHLWTVNGSRYLLAHCYKSDEIRTFHMNRFSSVKLLEETFENEWQFDMEKHARETFGVFHAKPERVIIWLDTILEQYILDHPLHSSQVIKPADNGFHVELLVGINESLVSRITGFGAMAHVTYPDKLAIVVMERHRAALANYSRPPATFGTPALPLKFD